MDFKQNLEAKLLAVGALVLGLVLAIFVVNSYKGASSSQKSVIAPATPPITPPAPAAVPLENLPQGVTTLNQNPINDTTAAGAPGGGSNIPGNVPFYPAL